MWKWCLPDESSKWHTSIARHIVVHQHQRLQFPVQIKDPNWGENSESLNLLSESPRRHQFRLLSKELSGQLRVFLSFCLPALFCFLPSLHPSLLASLLPLLSLSLSHRLCFCCLHDRPLSLVPFLVNETEAFCSLACTCTGWKTDYSRKQNCQRNVSEGRNNYAVKYRTMHLPDNVDLLHQSTQELPVLAKTCRPATLLI